MLASLGLFGLMLMEYRYDRMKLHQYAATPQIGGREAVERYVEGVKARSK